MKDDGLLFFLNNRQFFKKSGVDCGGGFDSCDNNDFSSIKASPLPPPLCGWVDSWDSEMWIHPSHQEDPGKRF